MKRSQLEAHLLVLVTLALVAFGLVMVYSATSAPAAISHADPSSYLKRQSAYALVGVVLMLVAMRLDYRVLRRAAPTLLAVSFLLCVGVLVAGQQVNGARRWLSAGPVVFQPAELAKLGLAVWVAAYLARRPPRSLRELARPLGVVVGAFCGLLLLQPDLGTTIAMLAIIVAMLAVAGTPARTLAAATAALALVGLFVISLQPYMRTRLTSFLDPWNDTQGAGFQTVQAMIGLGSGGIFGAGLGHGVQKIFYLPEAHTDMILAVVGEELGLVGTAAIVLGFAVFGYAALSIALASRDPFAKLLAVGLTTLVCGQAAINLAAVLGLAPLTGIPLPFVSYGGSNLVVALVSVGIVLNIAANGGVERVEVPDRGRRDRRPRDARARGRGGADGARRARDVRRVAGAR